MNNRCLECGRPQESHTNGTAPTYCTGYKTMQLPAGQTCKDCQHFKRFCSQFLGPEIEHNTNCDWYPIRFVPKIAPAKREAKP